MKLLVVPLGYAVTIMDTNYVEKHAPLAGLKAHDFSLLGESINLSDGSVQFEHVDVSLPGNSHLPVEIRRRLDPSKMQGVEFGDWQLAIPTISTKILATEWSANRRWGKVRCSTSVVSAIPNAMWPTLNGGGPITPPYYSDGVILDVPGRTKSPILDKTVTAAWPTDAKKVTADNWYLTCLSNIDGAGTEGFIAVAPNGDRYTFNVVMNVNSRQSEFDIWEQGYMGQGPTIVWTKMGVHYDVLAVSEITDVHGNWVRYHYDVISNNNRLSSISSSDGRLITIARSGGLTISSVTANGRQWTYTYGTKLVSSYGPPAQLNGPAGPPRQDYRGTLIAVTLPDQRQWQFDLANLHVRGVPGSQYGTTVCKQIPKTVRVTHPDGVLGVFNLEEVTLRIGQGSQSNGAYCPNTNVGGSSGPLWSDVMAVTKRTLSGPGMPTSVWTYSYASGTEIVTSVIQPDNTKRVVRHPVPYTWISPSPNSKLSKEELFATPTDTVPVQTIDYTYLLESSAGSNFVYFSPNETFSPIHSLETTITRGTDWYKTRHTYDFTRTNATYSYGFPTQIDKWSSLNSGTRTSSITYKNDSDDWLLGLPDTVRNNGKVFDHFVYDTKGRVTSHDRFDVNVGIYGYFTSGTQAGLVNTYQDALNRQTTFSDYHRGIPKTVTRNDNTTLRRTVDDNGWVTGITDWKGVSTIYEYNAVGRLTLVNRPLPWSDTSIGYSNITGSLVQTISRGTEQTATTYDGMLRPTQAVRQALSGGGGPIYTSNTYDTMGRHTFASLPAATAGSSTGIATEYDALGRVRKKRETAAGGRTHNFTYPAGNKVTVTDQDLFATTTTSSGYGNPNDGDVTSIVKPEGISVTNTYNIHGNLTGISQSRGGGTFLNSAFVYDNQLRLCRKSVPETGDTLYAYNFADELTAYAEGQAAGSPPCPQPPAGVAVVLTYDSIGRLSTTNYPNSTPDIYRTYDNNSNLLTLNRGGANWAYTYNTADLIATERLSIDGLSYGTVNTYDSDERLTQKAFPSGRVYVYSNDGLGQLNSIQRDGTTYVSGVSWHPNGKIRSLTQGNGNVFDQLLNERQLTSSLGSTYGDDFNYLYDANGRIQNINAVANNAYDRTFTYDGVGRLKTASGPWGAGTYNYDPLGNLTSKLETLNSRAVNVMFDARNRVSQVQNTGVSSSWRTYSHDARGNVTADGIRVFTYDDANQPTSISGTGGGTYTYDGNFRRVKTVSGGATTYTFYDRAGNLLGRNNRTASTKTDYLSVAGQTFVRVTNGVASYPINDHLGTALWVAAQNGAIQASQTYNYNPSGEAIAGSGAGRVDQQGFTGHVEDASGLTYMQARYYDPVIGRFLQPDPIGYADGLNLYAYIGNDPVNGTDPTGLDGSGVGSTSGSLVTRTPSSDPNADAAAADTPSRVHEDPLRATSEDNSCDTCESDEMVWAYVVDVEPAPLPIERLPDLFHPEKVFVDFFAITVTAGAGLATGTAIVAPRVAAWATPDNIRALVVGASRIANALEDAATGRPPPVPPPRPPRTPTELTRPANPR